MFELIKPLTLANELDAVDNTGGHITVCNQGTSIKILCDQGQVEE